MLIFLGISAVLCAIGALLLRTDAGRRAARDEADELEAVRLRLVAAGEVVGDTAVHDCNDHDCNDHEPYPGPGGRGTVYTSSAAPVDEWMVKAVTVDPTLTAADVATAVEHVAPGVGSMASFAAAVEDTRMRTSAQLHELQAAEEAAYAEAPEQEDRLFFADFRRKMEAAFTDFTVGTRKAAQWVNRFHDGEHYANCEHCARVHDVHSDEYAMIVADREGTDTREIPRADLRAMLARA